MASPAAGISVDLLGVLLAIAIGFGLEALLGMPSIPDTLGNVDVLEDWLSRPSASAMTALEGTSGDILVLGAGGKMGPTLTRMVKRA